MKTLALWAIVAVLSFGGRPAAAYDLHDSHFHLTNYIQEGTDIRDFLTIMGDRVGRVPLVGVGPVDEPVPVLRRDRPLVDGERGGDGERAPEEVRRVGTRFDDQHADPEGRDLRGQRLRHRLEGKLRGGVVADAGIRDESRDRAHRHHRAVPAGAHRRPAREADRVQLSGITVLCIDNDLSILDGMETLLGGWGCRVLKATDLEAAIAVADEAGSSPDGLLVDYHLDDGNGIDAIAELRRRFGADLTAVLITADRSPHVREDARANDIQVLTKPLKPAALRALLTQRRVQRVAAE